MPFRQLDILAGSRHICRPIALLRLTPHAITERFGIAFEDGRDDLDELQAALIESDSGRKFGLVYYLGAPEPRGTAVWANELCTDLSAEFASFAATLPIPLDDFVWVHPDIHRVR